MEQFSQSCKEIWGSILSWFSPAEPSPWHEGYVTGVLTLALLLLCCMLIWLVLTHHRALRGIVLPAANGFIFISARSISDLVKSLDADFDGIAIRRVALVERKKNLVIELNLICQLGPSSRNMQEMIEALQAKVLESLKNVFGIATVSRVDVVMARGKPVRTAF